MATTIVTGANTLRARTTLLAADILALDTVPVLLAPAIPGKSLVPVALAEQYIYGTTTYTISTGVAQARYGNAAGGSQPFGTTELLTALINAKTVSQFKTVAQGSVAAVALTTTQGLGIYLVATTSGFAATGGNGSVEFDLLYQPI